MSPTLPGKSGSYLEDSDFQEIEHLIAQNKLQDAIERLSDLPDYRNEASYLSRRWDAIKDKERKQLLSRDGVMIEQNKLASAILELLEQDRELPETIPIEIEHGLSQNTVLETLERLRDLPAYRKEATLLSRRWYELKSQQRQQTLSDEEVASEQNILILALLELLGQNSDSSSPSSAPDQTQRDSESQHQIFINGTQENSEVVQEVTENLKKPKEPTWIPREELPSGPFREDETNQEAQPEPSSQESETRETGPQIKTTQIIHLRSEPQLFSDSDLDQWQTEYFLERSSQNIQNHFEDVGEVIVDHATGLTWQQSGSERLLTYGQAQNYIHQVNQETLGGYSDWRLPTIPELISLTEATEQSNKLYINPMFDQEQWWCWSADTSPTEAAWYILFNLGYVGWNVVTSRYYVRCVRS